MTQTSFIQVILPLRLEWEPYYKVPEHVNVQVGDRVRVIFANAFYVGTVSEINVSPTLDSKKILPLEAVEENLPVVSPEEIRFWRELAAYYLCTVGEVYKAAYPRMAHHKSRLALPATEEPHKAPAVDNQAIHAGFQEGKPVLLCGWSRIDHYLNLALDTWKEGKSTLILVPEVALSSQLEEQVREVFPSALLYNSHLTPGKRKAVAEKLRSGEQYVLLGTRSALLLPHRNLGLVIVDEEHDPSFKQDSPAPRYHARESGIMLALAHGAKVLLGSATPSLESIYNAQCGRFVRVDLKDNCKTDKTSEVEIINTAAEARKKGMTGSLSLKLLAHMQTALSAGEQIMVLGPRRSYEGKKLEAEVLDIFPDIRLGSLNEGTPEEQLETLRGFAAGEFDILVGNNLSTRGIESRKLGLVAIVAADGILSRQDFRADERAVQVLRLQKGRCSRFVIQTREPHHPVFEAIQEGTDPTERILEERRHFGYPPFSRLVKVQVRDKYEKRLVFLTRELAGELGAISPVTGPYAPSWWPIPMEKAMEMLLLLPRDKDLGLRKQAISRCVGAFEQAQKYPGHIVIDVDPV